MFQAPPSSLEKKVLYKWGLPLYLEYLGPKVLTHFGMMGHGGGTIPAGKGLSGGSFDP